MIFVPLKEIKRIDQVAHFIVSVMVTFIIFSLTYSAITAIAVTMLLAVIREQIQHFGHCGDGCRTDLLFFLIGSLLTVMIIV